TGTRPFRGDTPGDVLASILRDEPRPLFDVPPALAHVVERCLEKVPSQRFQSVRDLAFALRAAERELLSTSGGLSRRLESGSGSRRSPAGGLVPSDAGLSRSPWPAGAAPAKSIAVLPFRNLSGGTETDYLGEGITEDILGALA